MSDKTNRISFQGELGAYSHGAIKACHPDMEPMPCPSFEDALGVVKRGEADLAMIPIENSTAGRVADIHTLLPDSGLYIIREHFEPIRHCLMAKKGVTIQDLKYVTSHVQALSQCRKTMRRMGLEPKIHGDTAGAAKDVAEGDDLSIAALASTAAADHYGLEILDDQIQDNGDNTTRFVVLSRVPNTLENLSGPVMTSFTFEVRNIPAALYKALGGFATNGVNMTKLESYYDGSGFTATEFYVDIEGDEREASVARAIEELRFHARRVRLFGSYKQARPR